MKLLNYDNVLCISAHPDDVEYGMIGTIEKYCDTNFHIIVLSSGGKHDHTNVYDGKQECESIRKQLPNVAGEFIELAEHVKDIDEDDWIKWLETSNIFDLMKFDCIFSLFSQSPIKLIILFNFNTFPTFLPILLGNGKSTLFRENVSISSSLCRRKFIFSDFYNYLLL